MKNKILILLSDIEYKSKLGSKQILYFETIVVDLKKMILTLYIIQNLFLVSIINNKIKKISHKELTFFIISLAIILYIHEPSNDILSYKKQISSPHQFEPLFASNNP